MSGAAWSLPPREMKRLKAFLGTWAVTAEVGLDGFDPCEVEGIVQVEWGPGGHSLLRTFSLEAGGEARPALEVVRWDTEAGTYVSHRFDGSGTVGVHAVRFDGATWTEERDGARFVAAFTRDGRELLGRTERPIPDGGSELLSTEAWRRLSAAEVRRMRAAAEDEAAVIEEWDARDTLFAQAAELVLRHRDASTGLLQRRLSIGYGRAARIMDQLERAGVVGPPDGSAGREIRVGLADLGGIVGES